MAPVDAVIDDVFGKQLGMQERQLAADEVAYSFFSSVREECGDQMDPETSAELNRLLALAQSEKGETFSHTLICCVTLCWSGQAMKSSSLGSLMITAGRLEDTTLSSLPTSNPCRRIASKALNPRLWTHPCSGTFLCLAQTMCTPHNGLVHHGTFEQSSLTQSLKSHTVSDPGRCRQPCCMPARLQSAQPSLVHISLCHLVCTVLHPHLQTPYCRRPTGWRGECCAPLGTRCSRFKASTLQLSALQQHGQHCRQS